MSKDIQADIDQHGRHIICVFDCGRDPSFMPFAYTIGNWAQSLPELLMVGSSHGVFLNNLCDRMVKRGRAFADGEVVVLDDGYVGLVKIINADKRAQAEYTFQATYYYGCDSYPVQQVLLRDKNGYFPTAKKYSARKPMPVLSAKVTT